MHIMGLGDVKLIKQNGIMASQIILGSIVL